MNTITIDVPFIYRAQVVKPRCRKPVEICVRDLMQVEIKCLSASDMPVAFRMSKQTTHAFNDRLWSESKFTAYGHDPIQATLKEVLALTKNSDEYPFSSASEIAPFFNIWHNVKAPWDEGYSHAKPWLKDGVLPLDEHLFRVMVDSNREDTMQYIHSVAESMVSVDGVMYSLDTEPRYYVITFGLCNNHGGTSLSLTSHYNSGIPSKCYFSAAQREDAVKYALNVAKNRGDTESFESIKNADMIEVLMPEMVKVNPAVDHPVE
ncbi:hypothetical protein OTK49_21185 [Vibrio coralliirubri]|uniref:hypothetical protein n=1 Tax=Vibrio coralliirubri TaxID=1516159 RepID=UPI0022847C90|nr:hypothetical protein [Vibrio coralliirubri]MCY9865035.1 hypothetical protein [Vibrio coralliirubri]